MEIKKYKDRKDFMNDLFLYTIKKISDIGYQRKLWIEGIPGKVDDWDETICTFSDDINIDEFLKDLSSGLYPKLNQQYGFSANQIDALWKFRDKLRSYSNDIYKELEEKRESFANPEEILNDPRWHKVADCAKETLKAFEGYKVPTEDMLKIQNR